MLAELKTIPARVRQLTDEQVKEIQLKENLQRENPHPLHEAEAILQLQESGKTLAETAKILGKSMPYIHNRIKLAELVEPLKELFFAGKLTMLEAVELGSLAKDSQEDFFNRHCANWKEDKNFSIRNTRYVIDRYKYDLKNAPFNTRDKKLVPDAGACTGCPFNSATLKSLFPDMAKEAVCSNISCFGAKRLAGAERNLRTALETEQPGAILPGSYVNEDLVVLLDSLPDVVELPRYNTGDVKTMKEPAKPGKEDYYYWNGEKNVFSREQYSGVIQEYRDDLTTYKEFIKLDATCKALLLMKSDIIPVYINPELRPDNVRESSTKITAKEVQQAIKEGTATEELLTAEMDRIKTREERWKELDREKVQVKVHESFVESMGQGTLATGLTGADNVALRYILYQGLNYQNKNAASEMLFPKGYKNNADFFEKLAALSDEQVAFLVRTVITGASESKTSSFMQAHCLYRMAEDAGLNVGEIETQQKTQATTRQGKLKGRIKDLQVRIKRLLKNAA